MRCLDLFCGGGGATLGLIEAGFSVVGIDLVPSPRYPAPLIVADALTLPVDVDAFDLVWASPPCQLFSASTNYQRRDIHVDLLTPIRSQLKKTGVPFIIENVPNAPMRADVVLTGPMVGLPRIKRRRLFELSWWADGSHFTLLPEPVSVSRKDWSDGVAVTITTSMCATSHYYPRKRRGLSGRVPIKEARQCMGVTTEMTCRELGNAVAPPMATAVADLAIRQLGLQ